jgi:hypothetical protein
MEEARHERFCSKKRHTENPTNEWSYKVEYFHPTNLHDLHFFKNPVCLEVLVISASCYGCPGFDTTFNLKALIVESFLNFFIMCLHRNCIAGEKHINELLGHLKKEVMDVETYRDYSRGAFLPGAFEKISLVRREVEGNRGILITIEFDSRQIQFRDQQRILPVPLPALFEFDEPDMQALEREIFVSPEDLDRFFS